jgi:hypothetical protein
LRAARAAPIEALKEGHARPLVTCAAARAPWSSHKSHCRWCWSWRPASSSHAEAVDRGSARIRSRSRAHRQRGHGAGAPRAAGANVSLRAARRRRGGSSWCRRRGRFGIDTGQRRFAQTRLRFPARPRQHRIGSRSSTASRQGGSRRMEPRFAPAVISTNGTPPAAQPVVILNDAFARRFFGGRNVDWRQRSPAGRLSAWSVTSWRRVDSSPTARSVRCATTPRHRSTSRSRSRPVCFLQTEPQSHQCPIRAGRPRS